MICQVVLTPLEPYFFGDERTFSYSGMPALIGDSYFIKSQDTPSQTTLFGALRYLGNRKKTFTGGYQRDNEAIGAESYDLSDNGNDDFGWIKGISPLLIQDSNKDFYVPVPLDHVPTETMYTPYDWTSERRTVVDGLGTVERILPQTRQNDTDHGYAAKIGLASGWLNLSTCEVHRDLFHSDVRVGNAASERGTSPDPSKSFFKRETKFVSNDDGPCSFTFFADLDDQFTTTDKVVYLGQRRSAFSVEFVRSAEEICQKVARSASKIILNDKRELPAGIAFGYAGSDLYVPAPDRLSSTCLFAITETREHRALLTKYGTASQKDRFFKKDLLHLIRAGSVFLIGNVPGFLRQAENPHAQIAGFNRVLIKEG